jgi:hypothetical protein
MHHSGESAMKIPTTLLLAFACAFYLNFYASIYAALILILVALYALFDLVAWRARIRNAARFALVSLIVMLLVVPPTWLEIQARHTTAPYAHIHDGAIQTEEAIRFLLAGKNPYVEDYTQTPMAQWPGYLGLAPHENIALFYLPYLPFTFLAPLPFYWLFHVITGFFDLRMYHLVLFVAWFLLLFQLKRDWEGKLALVILVTLNPLFVRTFIEGRNDIVVLWWLTLALYFLQRRRMVAATVALGLACVVKATAWFAVPFFLAHLWFNKVYPPRTYLSRVLFPLLVVGLIFVAPFVVWDLRAFVQDALWYQSSAFPIVGWGLSRILLDAGVIPDPRAPFPFTRIQAIVGIPLLVGLLRWQQGRPSLQRMIAATAVCGFVIGYVGRAFADNHIGFMLSLALFAVYLGEESQGGLQPQANQVGIQE